MNKKFIERSDWTASFNLVGKVALNDFSFNIDEQSQKSDWIYNRMRLNVDCGEKHGYVAANMMGGYGAERENFIRAYGKDSDGKIDYDNKIEIAWEDRLNPEIVKDVHDFYLITVGIEKDTKGKTYYKKFLSPYDAIAYMEKYLEDGTVVNVKGRLKYSLYQDTVQVSKEITSIALSKAEPDKYRASFTQTVLLDKDSCKLDKTGVDTDRGVMYVDARVLEWVKEINNKEVGGQYPFRKDFEFKMDFSNQDLCKKIYNGLLKVKKNVTQITFEGEFIEGGAMVTATWDDVPDDIKDLVEWGVYTKDEALKRCSSGGNKMSRMVFTKPSTRLVGEDKVPQLLKFENKYTEDDLYLDYLDEDDEDEFMKVDENAGDTIPFDSDDDSDDNSWLDSL